MTQNHSSEAFKLNSSCSKINVLLFLFTNSRRFRNETLLKTLRCLYVRPFKSIFFTTEKTPKQNVAHLLYSLPTGFKEEIIIDNITSDFVCTVSLRISIQIFHNIKHYGEGGKEALLLKSNTAINCMVPTELK